MTAKNMNSHATRGGGYDVLLSTSPNWRSMIVDKAAKLSFNSNGWLSGSSLKALVCIGSLNRSNLSSGPAGNKAEAREHHSVHKGPVRLRSARPGSAAGHPFAVPSGCCSGRAIEYANAEAEKKQSSDPGPGRLSGSHGLVRQIGRRCTHPCSKGEGTRGIMLPL